MKRSKHNLSHTKLLSCDMGELIPLSCVEVLPGDSVMHSTSLLLRAQPLLAPVMHPVDVRVHHWYVPFRLIWPDFEEFITGGPAGTSTPVPPYYGTPTWAIGSLPDYLGFPTGVAINCSALPMRAYGTIWNEWYRDQDLQTEIPIGTASGQDTTTGATLQRVAWEKDYFTSARPWEQKGPSITLPLGSSAPVNRVANAPAWSAYQAGTQTPVGGPSADLNIDGTGNLQVNTSAFDMSLSPNGGLEADLTTASAITVRALRQALALQRFEEARARYGSRYTEYLRYLGVTSSDARLQRPEYLGGGKQTIQFSEVLQTAPSATTGVVGTLRGHGIAALRSNRYKRFFEEHGLVLTLMSARPKTMYAEGLPRKFNRTNKEMFWQKELEHIGQQSVLNSEIYAAHASPTGTFGYQDRYQEYRQEPNTIAGEFKNSTLDFWHMARIFGVGTPALNSTFVSCVPTERVFPVPSEDVLYIHARHNMVARRLVAPVANAFTF